MGLPVNIEQWFASKGWQVRAHQRELLDVVQGGADALLLAPTGAGKTLAGFLPSLAALQASLGEGLHTLYISPLKALAVDIARNLEQPVADMALPLRLETRTGDTNAAKKARQKHTPPHILLTTPESLALLLASPEAAALLQTLRHVIVDEVHALAGSKRGDLLSLNLARIRALQPKVRVIGLSATVAEALPYQRYIGTPSQPATVVQAAAGASPVVEMLLPSGRLPWSGHLGLVAMPDVYKRLQDCRTALIFVNTRAQAELIFQELWKLNDANLPIALHHGSLAAEQRRKVEAAMAAGRLRAVVATSSLDLGIDWAAVDMVVQVGAPKGVSRLLQRLGRSNHRLDEPSRALLVPTSRFEVLECQAAMAGVAVGRQDAPLPSAGHLDVLAQHILACACAAPFHSEALYEEIKQAAPYADITKATFDTLVAFVATGGYALQSYDRFAKLTRLPDGRLHARDEAVKRQYRLNAGTIVEAATYTVKLHRGGILGEVEEYFVLGLSVGDTFVFAGQLLRMEAVRGNKLMVSRAGQGEPKVPAYVGGRLPLSTYLADGVKQLLHNGESSSTDVAEWLALQKQRSVLPPPDGLLVETFPRAGKHFLVAYTFAGRNAHQTLGMLLTRRLQRQGLQPLGFVANDYALAVWGLKPITQVEALFTADLLGDELQEWLEESPMLKRLFRNVAVIAGLIDRRHVGAEKTGRQVMFSADMIYDVLRRYDAGHILLEATRQDAADNLIDTARLTDVLLSVQGRIHHQALARVSPLAVPLILEVGREAVGGAVDALLEAALVQEALA